MATLDDLFAALAVDAAAGSADPVRATSLRLPEHVHRAATIATELGMDESFTAATSRALMERVRVFARGRAIAEHLERFPDDRSPLSTVVLRRLSGSDHPAEGRTDLVTEVAARVERRHPDWAVGGQIDDHVDRVIETVEILLERDGSDSSRGFLGGVGSGAKG